ncbi:MAG: hypothetical protein ACLGQW_01520 [Acidobacteriota bacterium]
MSIAALTTRLDSCLATLRRLKEISSRREAVEREVLLAVLLANRERLSEFPSLESDQNNLVSAITTRCELLPAHAVYREWMGQFLTTLNQYEVASRVNAKDQVDDLLHQLANLETLLLKCMQGYILLSGAVRDDFNDVILERFGESALADIEELTHAGFSDDRYWKALLERFVTGFVKKAYEELLEKDAFRIAREGGFIAVRCPLDAFLDEMPGTDKQIDKTRLQQSFENARQDAQAQRAAQSLAAFYAGSATPLLPGKPPRQDFELLGLVASVDPVAQRYLDVLVDNKPYEAAEDEEPEPQDDESETPTRKAQKLAARKAFLRDQATALAVGAAFSLGISREDLQKALSEFPPRERESILHVAGTFAPASLAAAFTLMIEHSLCALLSARVAEDAGKVQVRCLRQRRASRQGVEALAAQGFNRIRQKLFFEDDPASQKWLLFKAKTGQELAEAIRLSNMEPELAQGLTALWTAMHFKAEAVALVNLALVAKATQNVQGKVGEILGRLGVVKSA